jgi:hypothetical protein
MPFKYYIIYMKPLYRQNSHYIGKSTTSRLTYRLVTKSVPCRLDSTYRLENLACNLVFPAIELQYPVSTTLQQQTNEITEFSHTHLIQESSIIFHTFPFLIAPSFKEKELQIDKHGM